MTPQQIADNRQRFIDLCHEHIHRDGLDKLLAYLDNTDFYTAPSSTAFHLNEDGGLCRHSLNVFDMLCRLYEQIALPHVREGEGPFTEEIPMESLAISALFHDLCKIKLYHKTQRWRKDDNGRWESYDGYEARDEFPFGHGEKSCLMLSWYMRLRPEEMLAIRWHMGMYDMGENGSILRRSFYAAAEKSLLVCLLQSADFLASKLVEKTTQP